MFTGIVEEIGYISNIKKLQNVAFITVDCKKVLEETKVGDSIAINGACQTVTELSKNSFMVFCSYETLKLTTLGDMKFGDKVNLERAMLLTSRLGGHMVTGHIDGKGKLISSEAVSDAQKMIFETSPQLLKQLVKKGSVAIDGISLTVADIDDNSFSIAVIPHTYKNTTLKSLKNGSEVNLETDILGKYVEKFLHSADKESNISEEFLNRNGFM